MKKRLGIAVALLLFVPAYGGEIVVVAERVTAAGDQQLLVTSAAEMDGAPVDEIRLSLPKKIASKLEADALPDGWKAQIDKAGIVLTGPAAAAGEALGISFNYTGKSPIDKLQVGVDLLGGGKLLDSGSFLPQKLEAILPTTKASALLRLPYGISPGERISLRPEYLNLTPGGGMWKIDDEEAEWNGDFKDVEYEWDLGADYKVGSKLSLGLSYTDAWGETLVEGETNEINVVPATSDEKPSIGDCSPEVLTNEIFCVCGNFPTSGSRVGLTLNGRPLGRPISASKSALTFRLPEGVPPGEFVVAGAATAGYDASDRVTGLHVAVGASIDSNLLRRGESTPLRLWIEGTTDPVTMRVWNETPEIVSLDPKDDQQVTTSGGSPNDVSRRVDAVSVGDFVLNYELTIGSCPCAEQLAEQGGATLTKYDEGLQATRTRCRDLDSECEELRVLAELAEDWARTLRSMADDAARDVEWHEERADWLDEVTEKDREYLNTLRRQAAAWRQLADDAQADAEKNWERHEKYPDSGWDYWARLDEENARRRDEAAERLETEAARLEREIRSDSAEAEELRNRATEADRLAQEAEEQAAAARAAYEDCLRRQKQEQEECDWSLGVELRYSTSWGFGFSSSGSSGGTTSTGTPPGDDPRDEGGGTPYGEELDDGICPQRDGNHKPCVALIIDIAKHDDWRPGSLTDSKEYLEELGCDVDYVAPYFLSVPPRYTEVEKEVLNPETGEWETKTDVIENDRSQNVNVEYNALQMSEVNGAIRSHRAKMRAGAIMAIQMVYAHGSRDKSGENCGWLGPSIDFYTNGISRKYFHDNNYRAAKNNVCIWHVVDASCYSWQTPRAVDELNNHGQTDCHMDTKNTRDLHAGYEMDIAQSCSKQGFWEVCSNYGIAYFEDDINDVWEDEVDRQSEPGYDHKTAFTTMLPELRKAVQSNLLDFSTYADKGYEECEPPQHTRVGPYWK